MNLQWVGPAPSSNFSLGRQGNPISLVIQHWMDGSFEAALARFMDPTSIVSAHYLVGRTPGRIAQLVKDADTAYHAGNWNVNLLSIGIEAEASPMLPPTDALYANLAELYAYLRDTHHIDLVENVTVKPHRAIVATQCPGTIDIARIITEVGNDMTKDEVVALLAQYGIDQYKVPALVAEVEALYHHTHPVPPNLTGAPLVPPAVGARYFGADASFTTIEWVFADGSHRFTVNGVLQP